MFELPPPMPLTFFPGIIQFAMSPVLDTCIAPRIVTSKCPPLIIANEVELGKTLAPFNRLTVSLLAFIISEFSVPLLGYLPTPITPFSL